MYALDGFFGALGSFGFFSFFSFLLLLSPPLVVLLAVLETAGLRAAFAGLRADDNAPLEVGEVAGLTFGAATMAGALKPPFLTAGILKPPPLATTASATGAGGALGA